MKFEIHSVENAPETARPLLEGAQKQLGFVPNLYRVMATAPALLEAYNKLGEIWAKTSLSVLERQIVLLSINFENECHYCMAAHSAIGKMEKMPDDILEALRQGETLPDPKLEALRTFTREVVRKRGWVDESDTKELFDAGYDARTILEVNLAVGYKTLSNYTNHMAQTPVDDAFQRFAWTPPE